MDKFIKSYNIYTQSEKKVVSEFYNYVDSNFPDCIEKNGVSFSSNFELCNLFLFGIHIPIWYFNSECEIISKCDFRISFDPSLSEKQILENLNKFNNDSKKCIEISLFVLKSLKTIQKAN